jgi:hypothetical protein
MSLFSSSLFRVASFALVLPVLGLCDTFTANTYTADLTGSSLALGGSNSNTSTIPVSLTDGDTFSIVTPYASSFTANGTFISYFPMVTYTGSAALPSGFDAITVNYTQTFTGAGSFNGTYGETIPLVVGNWMTASGFLTVGSTALPTISLSGPGSYTGTGSDVVTGLPDGSVTEVYSITYDFFAGAAPGASGDSPNTATPEPAQMIPVGLGLIGFGLVALRRRRRQQV